MTSVTFVHSDWVAAYPEFSGVSDGAASLYFSEATLYLDNSDGSIVQDLGQRTALLYMLAAHIAYLRQRAGQGNAGLATPIASAQEGTVNISAAAPSGGTPAWYQMSTYGQSYWQATAQYRTARYVAPYPRVDARWLRR